MVQSHGFICDIMIDVFPVHKYVGPGRKRLHQGQMESEREIERWLWLFLCPIRLNLVICQFTCSATSRASSIIIIIQVTGGWTWRTSSQPFDPLTRTWQVGNCKYLSTSPLGVAPFVIVGHIPSTTQQDIGWDEPGAIRVKLVLVCTSQVVRNWIVPCNNIKARDFNVCAKLNLQQSF